MTEEADWMEGKAYTAVECILFSYFIVLIQMLPQYLKSIRFGRVGEDGAYGFDYVCTEICTVCIIGMNRCDIFFILDCGSL